jgi:hypothetical protein
MCGVHSGSIVEVLHLIGDEQGNPKLLLFENVPFVLLLDQGAAVMLLSQRLKQMDAAGRP